MGYKDENQSDADHAVDELAEVLVSLENGEDITESRVSASMKTSTGRARVLYEAEGCLIKAQVRYVR